MAVIPGTTGNDILTGTEEADLITGLEGADQISGLGGDDDLFGDEGNDTIEGGAGNDIITGEAGNDSIVGGDGDDEIDGGDNNDTIEGGIGNDFLVGNFGNDSIVGGDGDDTIDGSSGDDTIDGGAGNNNTYGLQANFGDGVYRYTIDDLNTEDTSDDIIVAVEDLRTAQGNDGFDTLINIQFIQFADYKIPALAAALDNDIPILDFALLENDPDLNASQLGSTTIANTTLKTEDTDNTAEQLTYTVTDLPNLGNVVVDGTAIAVGGTFTQAQVDAGLVAYTNTSGDLGDKDTFTFTVSDGLATLDRDPDLFPLVVTFEIAEQNDPVAADDSITANEDTPITVGPSTDNGLLDNDTDADGDVLTVDTVNGDQVDAGISITFDSGGIATIAPDGEVVFDPNGSETYNALAVGETATESFTYVVSDGRGGTDEATATITIDGVNDAPVATNDDLSGAGFLIPLFTILAETLLANDTDVDGDTLTITSITTQGTKGTATLDGTTILYDANDGFSGLDTFLYQISDGNGGTATAEVIVGGIVENTPPTADNDAYTTTEADILTVAAPGVLDGDTDPDEGDVLTVSEVDGETASVGEAITLDSGAILTLDTDGGFTYDPNGAFDSLVDEETAFETFTYTVSDGQGGTDEGTVTVTINGITEQGEANALDDAYTTGEDSPLNVNAPGVLENDQDPDTLSIIEIDGVEFTPGSTVTLSSRALLTLNEDGSFTYNPEVGNYALEGLDEGETGVDSFTYTVDNGTNTDTATVDITINGSDDPEQVIRTSPKAPKIPIGGGDVDFDVIYDVNNVPDGQDPTDLRTLGLRLHYNSSLISIEDIAADLTNIFGEPSNFASQQDLADEDDFDADPTTDRFILASWVDLLGGEGELTLYNVNFTPTEAFTEDLSTEINFTAASTAAGFILDAPSITIEFNEDPDAVDDALTINADGTEPTGDTNLLANDTDPDNPDAEQTLSITQVNGTEAVFGEAITLDSGALLTVSEDGSYTYDPNGAFNDLAEGETGTDSFTYTISDGLNGTDTATVNVTVAGVTSFTLDIDGNGTADALTDGILVLRHLFGFTGNSLTDGALAADATITDPATIAANLEANREALDIDDNGTTDALTDGILVLRDLFGFSGDALTAGALGEGAQRNTPETVATYIDTLFPG
jgi:VCBS repeat-containing protein